MEQALLARARAGDKTAFARLSIEHREAVYRAAYWILKDPEEALDTTQEAFLKAYRAIDRFDGRASFRTWVRRIATNAALDRVQRRRRDRALSLDGEEGSEPADRQAPEVGSRLLREERRRLVREAIESLPPAQKAAVVLRDVEGLSYAEIAETLGIARGTVMSRLYYGRQTLKEQLAPLLGPRAEALRLARAKERSR